MFSKPRSYKKQSGVEPPHSQKRRRPRSRCGLARVGNASIAVERLHRRVALKARGGTCGLRRLDAALSLRPQPLQPRALWAEFLPQSGFVLSRMQLAQRRPSGAGFSALALPPWALDGGGTGRTAAGVETSRGREATPFAPVCVGRGFRGARQTCHRVSVWLLCPRYETLKR